MQMYITECVGVEFVGIAVIIWGVLNTLGGFIAGLLMRYMASYVTVLVAIGLGQVGSFVFLIVWARQPSFVVIVIISAVFGLCYGVNTTTALSECAHIGVNELLPGAGTKLKECALSLCTRHVFNGKIP